VTSATTKPAGPITAWLAEDHLRLEALLAEAVAARAFLHRPAFDLFRAGLLRHIAIEEKILLPAAREARGGEPLPEARRLRIDHGALAALLVPPPTPELVAELRTILEPHNVVEEGPAGVYATCEALLAPRAEELAARIREYPAVKVAAYFDGSRVVRTAAEALRISGQQSGR
jgi:hypothetical protein